MKTLPPGLAAHVAGNVTTLASCWVITREDGAVYGFTDHDRPLQIGAVLCQPQNGLSASAMADGPGFAAGGGDVAGQLSGPALTAADLEAGLWDGARVSVYRVNWQDPAQHVLLRRAIIGEVSREGASFRAELRGLAHLLEARRGRVFQAACDADLGDSRCTVDLSSPAFSVFATVVEAPDLATLLVSGAEGFDSGWFTGGRLIVTGGGADGGAAGFATEIARHSRENGAVRLGLWQPATRQLAPGTGVQLTAGCDKRLSTCAAKFANHLNFQGFPHMPGADFVLSYPNRNTGENDGGPLVS